MTPRHILLTLLSMALMKFFRAAASLLKASFSAFMEDKVMKMSAALAYYTVFSLGPVLLIVFSVVTIVFGEAAVQGEVFSQIRYLIGENAALQVEQIIRNVNRSGDSAIGTIVAAIMLIITASVVFIEIQDTINFIWSVKSKPKKDWLKMLLNRVLSFSLLVAIGFLLMISLLVSMLLEILGQQLQELLPWISITLLYVLNISLVLLVISSLFAIIFKFLPDALISWKDAFVGAAFTSFLFLLGKFGIGFYLSQTDLTATYGAAASVMLLFLWVYYSSIILYFGAVFTGQYADKYGDGIRLKKSAVYIIKQEAMERQRRSAS